MRIHILGICGTFMAGLAVLAKQLGHEVTGQDKHVYPPMSDQLRAYGIVLTEGYEAESLEMRPDLVIVGNALSRGVPVVEALLNSDIPYMSGPAWLANSVLQPRHVIAVSGTHGKTTTASMVAWVLTCADLQPGFLIGGVPKNFEASAQNGAGRYFVIEADEYDSAFFDKRSKFMHYMPRTLIINNIEYDHADIFPNLAAIQQQFHTLIRTVPGNGLIICPQDDLAVGTVIKKGCWTPIEYFDLDNACWYAQPSSPEGSTFEVYYRGVIKGTVRWSLLGHHNLRNALAALAAAHHVGVSVEKGIAALNKFGGVKRRLEVVGQVRGITLYDDFAHHPTAIATTLAGLRHKVGQAKITVILECGSYTMRTGVHKEHLGPALHGANRVLIADPNQAGWNVQEVVGPLPVPAKICRNVEEIVETVAKEAVSGEHVLIMSNKGFEGIYDKLLQRLGRDL